MNRVTRILILWCLAMTVIIVGCTPLVFYLDTTDYGWLGVFCLLAFMGVLLGGITHLGKIDISSVRYSPFIFYVIYGNIVYTVTTLLFHYVIWDNSPIPDRQVYVSIILMTS